MARYKSLKKIVKTLLVHLTDDPGRYDSSRAELVKVRAFFRWVAENVRYDAECQDRRMSTTDILREKRGVGRQFVKIFTEMCLLGGVRAKGLKGFAKDKDYMPGEVERARAMHTGVGSRWRETECVKSPDWTQQFPTGGGGGGGGRDRVDCSVRIADRLSAEDGDELPFRRGKHETSDTTQKKSLRITKLFQRILCGIVAKMSRIIRTAG